MFQIFTLLAGLSTASSTLASEVKITSFKFIDSGSHFSPTAEICGELVQPTGKFEMVQITSDAGSKGPAQYQAWTGKNGKFCHLIATFTGKAEAELIK